MLVTVFGINVFLHPAISVWVDVSIIALQILRLSYFVLSLSTIIFSKLEQAPNTATSILVTLLGITIPVKSPQLLNAATLVRPVHSPISRLTFTLERLSADLIVSILGLASVITIVYGPPLALYMLSAVPLSRQHCIQCRVSISHIML